MIGPAQTRSSKLADAFLSALLIGGVLAVPFSDPAELGTTLFLVLVMSALVARLMGPDIGGALFVSASFVCGVLAMAFLSPAAAFAIPLVSELGGWCLERYRRRALLSTLAATATPTLVFAHLFGVVRPDDDTSLAFTLALAAAAGLTIVANALIIGTLGAIQIGESPRARLRELRGLAAAFVLNIAIAVALAELYADAGLPVIAFVLLVIIGFTYMARLVVLARERARKYANLSWGVLSGLIRTLNQRDQRAARHCAAVARFSRDIARHVGMSARDQELAHTAGLLHDIGRFSLSDRVMDRGGTLTDDDWKAIRRHPEIGADLLRDIGTYGPLSEIVIAHHERIDGRGYPNRLKGDDIPEISRIIAVAEVYDTLTAPDTYRTQMNSFEALTELRRVAGKQLDARYVEALAELLAGQGTEYRHADEADYDRELDIQRRMNEAAAT